MRISMSSTAAIPETRGGRAYRWILLIGGVSAIVGVADAARALIWIGLEALAGPAPTPRDLVRQALMLLAWSLIGAAAYHGWRRNLIPPTWLLASIMCCIWALIILQRIG